MKRAYYPTYNFYYGPQSPYQQQQQMRRNTIYPGYFMEPTAQSYYPEYNMQQQQQGFARSFQQQPYYEQAQYQAPVTSYNAVPFSGTVTPNKRTLYSNFNANPITSSMANSIKRYDTLSIEKPIKMINIPFKEKTNLFFRKQKKPSLVSSAPTKTFVHKRRHNATARVKTVIDSDKYKDRGIIKRLNMLIKSFHKASGMDSKELKNTSSKTLEDSEMRQPMEYEETKANRRHNGTETTEEDTFEIEDPSDKKPSKKDSSDNQKRDHSKKIENKTAGDTYSKKNQTMETSREMNVLNVVDADQPKMKNISTASPQQRHFLGVNTKKRNKMALNSTKLTGKSETHPKNTPSDKITDKPDQKSSGLEKITQKIKDTWNGMADEAVKLIKGEPKKDDNKAEEEVKKEDQKLKQLLTTSIKQQEARLTKDVTGEDIYDPSAIKIVNPKASHAIVNDALHGDWFDTAREPNEKTKNDIKMSSDVLSAISNAKMKGKSLENIQVATKPESKKQYESRVKKITNLAESTENDILSGLIQGSLGDAMPDKKPLKMKNIEKFVSNNKSPEKTDIGNIQKLLSKYNDDFDVFVDKTVDNHISAQPGIGKVVKQVNTMMDILPENEKINAVLPSDPSAVTGKKKNFNGHTRSRKNKNIALIESNEDDDDTLMKRLSEKWKMFKEANKDVLEGSTATTHKVEENIDDNTSLKSKLTATTNTVNMKGNDVLSSYFDQVEEKQAMDKSKELETRQTKRKERLKSTLHMISDIEKEIDSLVNKDTVNAGDSPSASVKQTAELETEKKEHTKKKGKAEIFKELTGTDNEEDTKQTPQGISYLKETPSSYIDEQQGSKEETTTNFNEPEEDEEGQEQPQNYMATPQYENPTGKVNDVF